MIDFTKGDVLPDWMELPWAEFSLLIQYYIIPVIDDHPDLDGDGTGDLEEYDKDGNMTMYVRRFKDSNLYGGYTYTLPQEVKDYFKVSFAEYYSSYTFIFDKIPFVDVKGTDYFFNPVMWAYYHDPQITNGIDKTHFGPNSTCTRAQVVTFLWRAAGEPEPTTTTNPFTDVPASQYYYKPVLWAVEKGITNGMSATKFGPNNGCTRGQVVTFLWRTFGEPEPITNANPFTDVASDQYYYKPVLWAVKESITNGMSATKFGPSNTCTRGQIVTFLYRAFTN